MNNRLENRNCWERHWKWLIILLVIILLPVGLFFGSGMGSHFTDFGKAFADHELTEEALLLAQENKEVTKFLGKLQPIDNMAILNGELQYSENNKKVELHVKVKGTKGKAKMDVFAERLADKWNYSQITLRIKEDSNTKIIEVIE